MYTQILFSQLLSGIRIRCISCIRGCLMNYSFLVAFSSKNDVMLEPSSRYEHLEEAPQSVQDNVISQFLEQTSLHPLD